MRQPRVDKLRNLVAAHIDAPRHTQRKLRDTRPPMATASHELAKHHRQAQSRNEISGPAQLKSNRSIAERKYVQQLPPVATRVFTKPRRNYWPTQSGGVHMRKRTGVG